MTQTRISGKIMKSAPTHKVKIVTLAVCSVLLPVVVILILTGRFQNIIYRDTQAELNRLAQLTASRVAADIYGLCKVSHDLIQRKIDRELTVAREVIAKHGGIGINEHRPVRWVMQNQFTGEERTMVLPRMKVGNVWLGQNDNPGWETPVIDEAVRLAGGTCTIFQRVNSAGDMLRVAASTVSTAGRREIGTYIPARNPDGQVNPIIAGILSGKGYRSLEYINQIWYLAAYEPLRNKSGEVIGMISAGEKLEAVESLRKTIAAVRIGKGGEVGILGTRGKYQGRYIISRDGQKDGQDAWNLQNKNGRYYIQDMVHKSLTAPPGQVTSETYSIATPQPRQIDRRIVAVTYFPPYDWFIMVSTREADFYAPAAQTETLLRWLLAAIAVAGLIFLISAAVVAAILGHQVTQLLQLLTSVAKNISAGDLHKARTDLMAEYKKQHRKSGATHRRGEMEALLGAFGLMTERLETTLRRKDRSGPQLGRVVPEVAAQAGTGEKNICETVTPASFASIVEDKIASLAEHVSQGTGKAQYHLERTIDDTQASRGDLVEMENSLQGLSGLTAKLTTRLTTINDRLSQVSEGVTAMSAIADHANLLALNASITAEKAGDLGKGFVFIAQEAGRLSNETEAAAQRIDDVANEIRSSVSLGLMESDILRAAVRKNVNSAVVLRERLDIIVEHLQAYDLHLERLRGGFHDASILGKRIDNAIKRLSTVSLETKESLQQFRQAMDGLNQAADGIQGELSGRGYSVVAREVKQMADQTVNAARDIDAMVKELQTSLSSGMPKDFYKDSDVQKGMENVVKISEQLCMVIDHLQAYNFQVKDGQVNEDNQPADTKHVDDAMKRLSAASLQARKSLMEFRLATERLSQIMGSSQDMLS